MNIDALLIAERTDEALKTWEPELFDTEQKCATCALYWSCMDALGEDLPVACNQWREIFEGVM